MAEIIWTEPALSEEADLPSACGLDLRHHERATGDEAEIVALLERPAQRSEQRRALAGRRQHRAFDAQRASTFAVDAQIEAKCRQAIASERAGDLVDDDAKREDELLARGDGIVPTATRPDPPRWRGRANEVAVLAPRERVRPRDRGPEPIEHRPSREIREVADGAQAEQPELVVDLLVDGKDLERERCEIRAAILDHTHLTRWSPLGGDAGDKWCRRDPRRGARTRTRTTRERAPRDMRRCPEQILGSRKIAREGTRSKDAHVRKRRVKCGEEAAMKVGPLARDDRERHRFSHR